MIDQAELEAGAVRLGCEVASIRAVAEVESRNTGMLPDGRPVILFEALVFHNLTGGRFDASHPAISSPVWDRGLYIGGAGEYSRLSVASTLNEEAALKSASWGAFQIMGFNFKTCGFGSVVEFVAAMKQGPLYHLRAFEAFVEADGRLKAALAAKDWRTFARIYNGPGDVASYAAKMADAYSHYAGQPRAGQAGPPIPAVNPNHPEPVAGKTMITTVVGGTAAAGSAVLQAAATAPPPAPGAAEILAHGQDIAAGATASLGTLKGLHEAVLGLVSPDVALILTVVAVACLAFVGVRYLIKRRRGELVST